MLILVNDSTESGDGILSSHITICHIGLCNNFFQGEQHLADKIVWSQRKSSSKESIDHSYQHTAISDVISREL